jgi:hypothetical protein
LFPWTHEREINTTRVFGRELNLELFPGKMDDRKIACVGTRLVSGGNPIHALNRAAPLQDCAIGDGPNSGRSHQINARGGREFSRILAECGGCGEQE